MPRPFVSALLIFSLVSLVSHFGSKRYVAEARIFFPAVEPQLFTELTRALKADPDLPASLSVGANRELSIMAQVILRSQAAQDFAKQKVGQAKGGGFEVTLEEGGSLQLLGLASGAEAAHDQISTRLDYYTDFVKRNPLTRVAKARADLELRIGNNSKALAGLEDQLVQAQNPGLRRLGDASLKVNGKVMSEVWLRRLDRLEKNKQLLKQMEKLRANTPQGDLPGSEWLQDWAGKRLNRVPTSSALRQSVPTGKQDLLKQAKLERDYYDALLLHRSLILQRSFLLTWDKLENSQYELLEPIHVRPYHPPAWVSLSWGLLVGALSGVFLSQYRKRPERG